MTTPEGLAAYMGVYFELELMANRLSLYASLQKDGDTTNPEYTGRYQQALRLTGQVMDEGAVLRQAVVEGRDALGDDHPLTRRARTGGCCVDGSDDLDDARA